MAKLINILLESNYPISKPQITRDEEDNSIISVSYYFNTDKNRYEVIFNSFEKPRVFEVEFGIDKGETYALDTDEMTGEGKALSILSTIADIINLFLQNFPEEYDKIAISGTNDKRKEVYRKFFPKKINSKYLDKVEIK
jgi:hypothetical protein